MKRCLAWLLILLLLPLAARADKPENFTLTATVAAKASALLALPIDGADVVLALEAGAALTVTALGTAYCEAECGGQVGYIATADIAFDILEGAETRLAVIDVSPTNQYHGRLTLRKEASTKSKALRKLARGCIVLLMEEEGRMVRVVLPDVTGYVLKDYIDDVEIAAQYRIAYVEEGVNAWLRLDSRYAKDYMICRLEPGTPVQFIANPNGWAEVEVQGHRGRMLAHNLTFEAPEEE